MTRRRAADGLLGRLARAVVAGSLLGVVGSPVTSCSRAGPSAAAERDTTARFAVLEGSASGSVATDSARASRAVPALRNECTECHSRTHDAVLGHGPAASARCADCHATVHDSIQALYEGISRRASLRPDPMFKARVQCAECHADSTFATAPGAARAAALDRACTSCHGPRFTGMLARWTAGMEWRTRVVSSYVGRAAADPRLRTRTSARLRVRAAQQALSLVTAGGGVHNVRGADALLRAALDSAASAYRETHIAPPERPDLGPDPADVSCIGCHYGIETARDSVFGQRFDHGAHVVRGDVACKECHSAADYLVPGKHDVDRRHGRTMVTASTCAECHHAETSRAACLACHKGDPLLARPIRVTMPLRLRPEGAPKSREVTFEHGGHAKVACASCHTARTSVRTVAACATCHETHHVEVAQCSKCHGTDARTAHKAADHLECVRCHARETVAKLTPDRSFCVSCHLDFADHKTGRECSTCHMQSTPAELRRRILGRSG